MLVDALLYSLLLRLVMLLFVVCCWCYMLSVSLLCVVCCLVLLCVGVVQCVLVYLSVC